MKAKNPQPFHHCCHFGITVEDGNGEEWLLYFPAHEDGTGLGPITRMRAGMELKEAEAVLRALEETTKAWRDRVGDWQDNPAVIIPIR